MTMRRRPRPEAACSDEELADARRALAKLRERDWQDELDVRHFGQCAYIRGGRRCARALDHRAWHRLETPEEQRERARLEPPTRRLKPWAEWSPLESVAFLIASEWRLRWFQQKWSRRSDTTVSRRKWSSRQQRMRSDR